MLKAMEEDPQSLKGCSLESQMVLKYELGHNIQKFYIPLYAYDCLGYYPEDETTSGIFRFHPNLGKQAFKPLNNLRAILIKRKNKQGKMIDHLELVELY